MNHTPLEATYDLVAIIDLLSDQERSDFHVAIDLQAFLSGLQVPWKYLKCGNRDAFFQSISHLAQLADEGKKFCIHLISHGNRDGIGLKTTNEFIAWKDFGDSLRQLNRKVAGTLIVNMTSCFGLHGIKAVDLSEDDLPFFGLIGAAEIGRA